MKTTFYFFLAALILFIWISSSAQVRDSLVQLTPEIGDTISISERSYYNLFPNIQGFEYATILIRNDSIAVSKIVYQNVDGKSEELVIKNNVVYIGNLRAHIRQIEKERPVQLRKLREAGMSEEFKEINASLNFVIVTTRGSNKLRGWLYSLQDSSITLIPGWNNSENGVISFNDTITIPTEKIKSVFIEGQSNALVGLGYGVLVGITFGVISGFAAGDDPPPKPINSDDYFVNYLYYATHTGFTAEQKAALGGVLAGLTGGLVGLLVGLVTSTPDEIVEINSAEDLELLKEYLPY